MSKYSKLRVCAAAAALFVGVAVSHATVVSAVSNNPLGFSWSFNSAAGPLTGSGSMTISGFNSSTLTLNVSLSNTSALASNRLTSFGFGIDPNVTSVSFVDSADGGLINAVRNTGGNTNIPSLTGIDVCAFGGNNCAGGSNGGILGGGSDSFSILLGGTWGSSVNIDPIGFKYQTGNGSFEFYTTSTSTSSGNTPEPSTASLAILGLALLGAGFGLRRRKTS